MTYSPIDKLGSTNTNVNFSFSSVFSLESSSTITEIILNCEVLYNNSYINNSFNGTSVIFTGNIPLDVFDQYQMTYVDKGKSDKNQIPVISNIKDMPDHKELYKIQPDARTSIIVPITINLKIQKTTKSESGSSNSESSSETTPSETIEIIDKIINYELEVLNDLKFITTWTKNYFENRY